MMHSDARQWTRVPLRRDVRFDTYFHTLLHDLRTPLTQITGFAELLELDQTLAVGQREYAAAIVSACGELNHAVLAHLRLMETSLGDEVRPEASRDNQPEQPCGNRNGWQELPAEFATGLQDAVAR
jgi:signal transduction histidine kinase